MEDLSNIPSIWWYIWYWSNARIHKTSCSMDFIYFLRSIYKIKHLFTSWNHAEKYRPNIFWKPSLDVSIFKTKKYFEWIIINKLFEFMNSAVQRCEELCKSSQRMLSTSAISIGRLNILLNLHDSSHPTHSMIVINYCTEL